MATPWTDQTPRATYTAVLRTANNTGLTSSLQVISDGSGIESPLKLSTTSVEVVGFRINGTGVTANATDLNKLDRSLVDGILEPSKAIVADAASGISSSGGIIDLNRGALLRAELRDYSINYINNGNASTNQDFDISAGQFQQTTLTGSTVNLTFSNPPPSGTSMPLEIWLKQDAVGSRLVSWPATVSWLSDVEPTLSVIPLGQNIIRLNTVDGGFSWNGYEVTQSGLHKLDDVSIASPISGQLLRYNGTKWDNADISKIVKTIDTIYPQRNEPPSVNAATSGYRNSRLLLSFPTSFDASGIFPTFIPREYGDGSGIIATIIWASESGTSDDVVWELSFERNEVADIAFFDLDVNSFATAQSGIFGTNAFGAGQLNYSELSFTTSQMDDLIVGDLARVMLARRASAVEDDMSGKAQLVALTLRQA